MSRRQNSSCDQCRKGKRACDAVWLRDRQLQRTTLDANGASQGGKSGTGGGGGGGGAGGASSAAARGSSVAASSLSHEGYQDDDFDLVGPCTNCARTNKQCTFEWVQSQQLQRKEKQALANSNAAITGGKPAGLAGDPRQPSQSQAHSSTNAPSPSIPLRTLRPSGPPVTGAPPVTTVGTHLQPHPSFSHTTSSYPMISGGSVYPTAGPDRFDVHHQMPGAGFLDTPMTSTAPSMGLPDATSLGIDTTGNAGPPTNSSYMGVVPGMGILADYGMNSFGTGSAPPTAYSDPIGAVWPSPSATAPLSSPAGTSVALDDDHHQQQQQLATHMRKRRRTQSPARVVPGTVQISASWAQQYGSGGSIWSGDRLARAANGSLIGDTMMRIYHDVMEGALSCWLTEQTCPYNSHPTTPLLGDVSQPQTQQQPQQAFWGTFEDMQREWGPNWSNRIYRRVIKLDRMSHLLGLKKLSHADEKKVSTALNAAVMAFTAQWAQSSQRSSARWQTVGDTNGEHPFQPPDLEMNEEFDRMLQKSFWNEARKTLGDCSEIDSFRVVFAEIIFGLTQKYWDDELAEQHDTLYGDDNNASINASQVVEDILREDTQQIWLERATRRLHVLRRRVEIYDRQSRSTKASDKHGNGNGTHACYDAECRKTIDLLFWLAVMFDTISAAMTERPLTVSDEDSSNLTLISHPSSFSTGPQHSSMAARWNVILAKDQQTKVASLRWPCTDTEIAQELTDAAPVKVLLYRKVTRLQTLVARDDEDPATIEGAVADALMVYSHWQAIYGGLFADCVAHHLLLSARIQSWYVCLFGHWLLATLLLVDLIEIVDTRGIGNMVAAKRRAEEQQARGIRAATVRLISDLARASTPRHDEFGELANFHHAVNEGALLTEPWTMILMRTFSRAAILLLDEHEALGSGGDSVWGEDDEEEGEPGIGDRSVTAVSGVDEVGMGRGLIRKRPRLERCEDCVKALWYLGRKSDMARQVANVLAVALQRARLGTR